MPREPAKQRRRANPRTGRTDRVPRTVQESAPLEDDENIGGTEEGELGENDEDDLDADLDGDDEDGEEPDEDEDGEPQLVSPRVQRTPDDADVQTPYAAAESESIEAFVAKWAPYVERDPENYAFELIRVFPKVDSNGNRCDGSVQEFWNTEQLNLSYLRQNFSPGQYKLAVRGIGKKGKRGVYVGYLSPIRLARRNPDGVKLDKPLDDNAPPRGAAVGVVGGNGASGHPVGGLTPWGPRGQVSSDERLLQVPAQVVAPAIPDMLDRMNDMNEKRVQAERERTALMEKTSQEKLDQERRHHEELRAMAERAAAAVPAPVGDPNVTARALELLSEQARTGPREQSATEQRLLEQINNLRADLAALQSRHVDELSKLRTDHMQELIKEREDAARARADLVATYDKNLEAERRRADEMRAAMTAQHQTFVSNIEVQNRAHVESIRSSLEARIAALNDQLNSVRDTLSQERAAHADTISQMRTEHTGIVTQLRTELSETKSRADSNQGELLLAKVEAQTAEVKGKLAGDSLTNVGKMLASVKSVAEGLGYVPAGGGAATEAPPAESALGTVTKVAGAAAAAVQSPEFAKLMGAVADRLGRAVGGTQQNPTETAAGVGAWQAYRQNQRQAQLPPTQVAQLGPAPAAGAQRPAAPPPPPAARGAAAQPPTQPPPEGVQTAQDALEDAAIEGEPPESFMGRMAAAFDVSLDTIRGAVATAQDADVWSFLGVDPAGLTAVGREYATSVLAWLRAPPAAAPPAPAPSA